MSTQIDQAGIYRGTLKECAVNVTSGGYPQAIIRVFAEEKYVDNPDEMEYFELDEPAWVPWSHNDESITGFLILFLAKVLEGESVTEDNTNFHYEDLCNALGWDGDSFDALNDDSLIGAKLQFHVAEEEYKGKTQFKVKRVRDFDASPTQELRKLDDDNMKALNQALRGGLGRKKKKAAKPASKPASKPAAAKGKAKASKPKAEPKTKKTPPPKEEEPAEEAEEPETDADDGGTELPEETTKLDAWNHINEIKGETDDGDIEKSFLQGCAKVSDGRKESEFTGADWAAVRDYVIDDLNLSD